MAKHVSPPPPFSRSQRGPGKRPQPDPWLSPDEGQPGPSCSSAFTLRTLIRTDRKPRIDTVAASGHPRSKAMEGPPLPPRGGPGHWLVAARRRQENGEAARRRQENGAGKLKEDPGRSGIGTRWGFIQRGVISPPSPAAAFKKSLLWKRDPAWNGGEISQRRERSVGGSCGCAPSPRAFKDSRIVGRHLVLDQKTHTQRDTHTPPHSGFWLLSHHSARRCRQVLWASPDLPQSVFFSSPPEKRELLTRRLAPFGIQKAQKTVRNWKPEKKRERHSRTQNRRCQVSSTCFAPIVGPVRPLLRDFILAASRPFPFFFGISTSSPRPSFLGLPSPPPTLPSGSAKDPARPKRAPSVLERPAWPFHAHPFSSRVFRSANCPGVLFPRNPSAP